MIISLIVAKAAFSQNPVSWVYNVVKVNDKLYKMHITATMQNGWHLDSQVQPKDAIAIPTSIKFNKNPLLTFKDKTKEIGTMEKKKEPILGIEAWQYAGKVEFVQTIKLKTDVKTNVTGNIEFQTCTDEKCLPPMTVQFNVAIQ